MSTIITAAGGVCDTNLCRQTGIQFGPYSVWLLVLALAVAVAAGVVAVRAARRRRRERQIQRETLAAAAGYPPDTAGLWTP